MLALRRRLWRCLTNPALILFVTLMAFIGVWVVAPLALEREDIPRNTYVPPTAELIRIRAMIALAACWIFAFGASVGSFLNVVVWRMPRGESLVRKPSRCPRCNVAIRPSDNIPIFGWLKLRGRCRVCRTRISARYPFVELLTGTIFLELAVIELLLQGVNLPSFATGRITRSVWMPLEVSWEQTAIFVYHAALVSALVCWMLIVFDHQRAPTIFFMFVAFVGLVGPVGAAIVDRIMEHPAAGPLAPVVHPHPWTINAPQALAQWGWPILVLDPVLGGLAGIIGGVLLSPLTSSTSRPPQLWAGMGVVGVYLGWHAAISVALFTSLCLLATALVQPIWGQPRCVAGWVLFATLVQITCWRFLTGVLWSPSEKTVGPALLYALLVFLVAFLAAHLARRGNLRALP